MANIDETIVKRVLESKAAGRPVLMRRTHDSGRIKLRKGPFRLMTERLSVNSETFEAIKQKI